MVGLICNKVTDVSVAYLLPFCKFTCKTDSKGVELYSSNIQTQLVTKNPRTHRDKTHVGGHDI